MTNAVWRAVGPPVARRADRVIAISHAGKRDIVEHLGVEADHIDAVHPGHGERTHATPLPEPEVRSRFALGPGPVVLTVSAKRAQVKNLERLVRAFARVREAVPGAILVLPGAPTEHEQTLKRIAAGLGLDGQVAFLGFVTAEELEGLYETAACFVLPSLNEGFGLPVQEAQRRGVPVACSRASALPEAAGDGARYFEPESEDDIAAAVLDLLQDPALAAGLVEAGREHQERFTWERSAELTLETYRRALAGKRR